MIDNWDEMCDEEKSFDAWFAQNNNNLFQFWIKHPYREINDKIINVLKTAYMQGYASGFQAKLKYSSDENLQK